MELEVNDVSIVFDVIEGPFDHSHGEWVYTRHIMRVKTKLAKRDCGKRQNKKEVQEGCCPTRLIIAVALILWARLWISVTNEVVHHILFYDWNKVTIGNCVESRRPKFTMRRKLMWFK